MDRSDCQPRAVPLAATVNFDAMPNAPLNSAGLDALERLRLGAGEGNRTLVFSLEGCCSTIELHPRVHYISDNAAALNEKSEWAVFHRL